MTSVNQIENASNDLKSKSPIDLVKHVERQWMPSKQPFVVPYTSKYRQLDHTTSSRIEGAHTKIKSYIEVSIGNLLTVFEKLRLLHH